MSSASRDLVIRIRGDSAEFVAAVDGAGRHLDDFGRRVESIDRSASATTASLARMGHGLTAFLGVREIIQAADAYGQYASRMRMAVDSAAEYEQAQNRMAASASETFRSINETRESFILMNPVLRQMGLSLDESIDAIDTFSGLLVVNAASSERASSAQAALAKSLQTGRIESDAWQSMMAAMPSLVGTLATSSGLAEAEIRKLGISGRLSVDMLTQALVAGNAAVFEQVRQMPTSIADALTNLGTAFSEYVGQTNEALGVTANVAGAIGTLGEHFDSFANAAIVAAGAVGGRYAVALYGAAAAQLEKTRQTRAATIAEAQHQVVLARTAVAQASATANSSAMAAARARETAATEALTAAQSRLASVAGVAGRAVTALGGPVGMLTMALTAGATAWAIWGGKAEAAAKQAAQAADNHIEGVLQKLRALNADMGRFSRREVDASIAAAESAVGLNAGEINAAARRVRELRAEIDVARDHGFSQRHIRAQNAELIAAEDEYQRLLSRQKDLQGDLATARDRAVRAGIAGVQAFVDANSVGATKVARERAALQAEFDRVMRDAGGFNPALPEHVAAQTALNQKLAELDKAARKAQGGLSEAEKSARDMIAAGIELAATLDATAAGYTGDFFKKWESLAAAYHAGKINLHELTDAQARLLSQQPAVKAAAEAEAKLVQARTQALQGLVDAESNRADALIEGIARGREEIETLGMTEQQLAAYTAAKLVATAAADEQAASELDVAAALLGQQGVLSDVAAEYRRLAAEKRRAAEAGRNASTQAIELGNARAAVAAADVARQAWSDTAGHIQSAIYDALISGGEDAADVLERTFKAMVIEPSVRLVAQAGSDLVMGSGSVLLEALGLAPNNAAPQGVGGISLSGGAGASGGFNGYGTLANQALGAFGGVAGAVSGIASLAAGTSLGSFGAGMASGLASFGSLGSMGATLSGGAAAGGAVGAGMIAGTVIPVVGAVLALASVLGAFGGGTPHTGAVVISGGAGDTVSPRSDAEVRGIYATPDDPWGLEAGQFRENDFYKRRNQGVADALTPVAEAMAEQFNALASALGGAGTYRVGLGFSADGDDPSRGRASIIDQDANELIDFGGKYSSDPQRGLEQFIGALGPVLRDALIAAVPDLDQWQADALRALGNDIDADALAAAVVQIKTIESASTQAAAALGVTADEIRGMADGRTLSMIADQVGAFALAIESAGQLGLTFDAAAEGAMRASSRLMSLAGGLDEFAGLQSAAYAMLTPLADQVARAQSQVVDAFERAGVVMPRTAEEYRGLLRAQDLLTESGRETYVELLKLAGSFDAVRGQALALAGIDTNALGQAIVAGLTGELTQAEIAAQLEDNVVAGIRRAMAGSVANEVMDLMVGEIINPAIEALVLGGDLSKAINAAHIDAVVADITARVSAFQAVMESPEVMGALDRLRGAMSGIAGAMGGAANASADAARAERDRASAISAAEAALRSAYQREAAELQAAANRMGDFARRLREFRESLLVGDRSPLGIDARAAAAERQFADVARRAALGDTDAMDRLQGVSEDYLDTSREAAASAEEYYRSFARVQGVLLKTEGVASRQERVAQQQLDALTAQVSALIEINSNVMSVRDAIAALHAARGTSGSSSSSSGSNADLWSPKNPAGQLPSGDWLDALPPGLMANSAYISPELQGLSQEQIVAYFEREKQRGQVPAFAAGGLHLGGLRLVGERGPELEVTGPARYYSAQQTQQMLGGGDNSALLREIAALRAEVRDLRAAATATARHTQSTSRLLARVSRDGNALMVEEVAA
ncbi:tape measure protein [Thauera butanivorans]|uniref:tape measure protein n=1 Tax=Thauera butanivorans TaxID=86174 RepID=UPI003AB80610